LNASKNNRYRIHLAVLSLASFLVSFIIARTYTTFFPNSVLVGGGLHIHHFWFGLALLAVGGWLGIIYNHKQIDMAAAVIYGLGGGLIVDEVGLLLTFGDYWSILSWTFLVIIVSFASLTILFIRYRKDISQELREFVSSKASPYFGIFLGILSIAFLIETDSVIVTIFSVGLLIGSVVLVMLFLFRQRKRS
jgi:hypothetical protein